MQPQTKLSHALDILYPERIEQPQYPVPEVLTSRNVQRLMKTVMDAAESLMTVKASLDEMRQQLMEKEISQ